MLMSTYCLIQQEMTTRNAGDGGSAAIFHTQTSYYNLGTAIPNLKVVTLFLEAKLLYEY